MNSVYLLQHTYEIDEVEDTKIIGVFSTEKKALEIIEHFKTLPGFIVYQDGFEIDEYQLDTIYWAEGFITI